MDKFFYKSTNLLLLIIFDKYLIIMIMNNSNCYKKKQYFSSSFSAADKYVFFSNIYLLMINVKLVLRDVGSRTLSKMYLWFFSLKAYISRTLVKEVVCSPLELFACVTVVKAQKNSDMTNLQFTIIIKKTCRQLKAKVS